MPADGIASLKATVRALGAGVGDRLDKIRRIYIEERASAFRQSRDEEYNLKNRIAKFYGVSYSSVSFTGSAQIGFSVHKDTLFEPGRSDLDVACIDLGLFEKAWLDVIQCTKSFSDGTKFSGLSEQDVAYFKEQIFKRGMIVVKKMPRSDLSMKWSRFEQSLGRDYSKFFGSVSVAIYMNEIAFCNKQATVLYDLMTG